MNLVEYRTNPLREEEVKRSMEKALIAFAAAFAVGIAGFCTAWAQSRIGSAGAGSIAEKPETGVLIIVLEALPETIILFGFVIAIQIIGMAD